MFFFKVGHKRDFQARFGGWGGRTKAKEQPSCFSCSEGWGRCSRASHIWPLLCWLTLLVQQGSWAWNWATFPWTLPQHLWLLVQVCISFHDEKQLLRQGWRQRRTEILVISDGFQIVVFLPDCLPCRLQAPKADMRTAALQPAPTTAYGQISVINYSLTTGIAIYI